MNGVLFCNYCAIGCQFATKTNIGSIKTGIYRLPFLVQKLEYRMEYAATKCFKHMLNTDSYLRETTSSPSCLGWVRIQIPIPHSHTPNTRAVGSVALCSRCSGQRWKNTCAVHRSRPVVPVDGVSPGVVATNSCLLKKTTYGTRRE